jgi:putative Ca2+/H+ antiporter (TMEM165/GDT1 family)
LEALLASTLIVAVGEIGDKTQLLAFLLAARYARPWPIVLGILAATLANHALAGLVGAWIRDLVSPQALHWAIGLSFLAIGAWALVPDKVEGDPTPRGAHGVFFITLASFFLAEMGDKTQLATVALAAHYPSLVQVVAGTTLGMMIADAPAVFLAAKALERLPFRVIRYVAAALFAAMGVTAILVS